MSPSVDYAASSLWCAESSIEDAETEYVLSLSSNQIDECLNDLLKREIHHLPCSHYLTRLRNGELSFRNEAVDWIQMVGRYYSFGHVTGYLSINYLDRFLSAHDLPDKAWVMQLLAVACLSLAAKMEETQFPLSLDLQIGESRFAFEAKTIERMELLVLTTLDWRMQSVTPFSFLDYFLCRICSNQMPPTCFFSKATQLIARIAKGIDFLEFRPSEIAAAVSICVALQTNTVADFYTAVSVLINCDQVKKEVVAKCFTKIQDLAILSYKTNDESAAHNLKRRKFMYL